jgi:hypothetical protein
LQFFLPQLVFFWTLVAAAGGLPEHARYIPLYSTPETAAYDKAYAKPEPLAYAPTYSKPVDYYVS